MGVAENNPSVRIEAYAYDSTAFNTEKVLALRLLVFFALRTIELGA